MNKRGIILVAVATVMAVGIQCAHKDKSEDAKARDLGQWQYKMLALSDATSKLLPLVASPRAFNDPKNEADIEKSTKTLASMAHSVSMTEAKPSGDPSLDFVSGKFSSDMNEAVKQLEMGNRKFARFLIRNATSYCIACHTRNDQGRQNLNLSLNTDLSGMSALDRAEYHMAVRDFDAAIKDFDQVINSADAQIESPQGLENAAEKTLAVAVRVKRDPELALKTVQKIMEGKWAPVYLKLNALSWKTALQEWAREPKKEVKDPKVLLARAKSLLSKGWKFSASSPQSRAGLVYFLRASTNLHDALSVTEKNPAYGEALYYAGLSAESLREMNLWTLHEAYYEACIRKQPYTALAKKCYLRLEALQLSAFSDLDGAYVPAHVRDHLRELRGLAEKGEGDFLNWGFVE